METFKCPLCGSDLDLWCDAALWDRHAQLYVDAYYYLCENYDCGLATEPVCDEEKARERVVQLISKFPPIMRLNEGDNVLIWLHDDVSTVLGVNLEAGLICFQDEDGDIDSCSPEGIKKWPWELEQTRGEQ